MGPHSLLGVGLGELHSLIELARELHNLLGVGWLEESLRVVAGLDSWVDSMLVELEVQQQLELEVGN